LTKQIDHLVDALRLHQHASSVELAPVPVAAIFADLLRDNSDFAHSRRVELRVCRTNRAVMSEPSLLAAILRNFVHNAVKYTPPGKRVVVGCRSRRNQTSIEVHDSGIGIPAAQLSRVFDAFHRIDSTRTDGLGLGLFIVKQIADLLGHALDVRSEVGRGSCFAVRVSAAADVDARCGAPS
jgi:signal transduction histidine kinase